MKLYKILFLPIVLLILSCDESSNTISNVPGEFNKMYEFNLMFSGDTDNSDTITLTWDENEDISTFNIEIDGDLYTALERDNYTFPLLPGLFKDVIITADDVFIDTIQVFSAPMAPSTWQPDLVGDIKVQYYPGEDGSPPYNQIGIIESSETDISEVFLYKISNDGNSLAVYETSLDYDSWTMLSSFNINNNNIFIEELNSDEYYCYVTNTIDESGNSRYSQIICNDLTPNIMESVNDLSISNNLKNKISIEWLEYTNSDFYQYTIYRSEDGEMNEESRIILVEIIYSTQTVFEDRNNIGKGKTWYYQIEVHNLFGRIKKSSIISGKSKP